MVLYLDNSYFMQLPNYITKLMLANSFAKNTLISRSIGVHLKLGERFNRESSLLGVNIAPGVETTVMVKATERHRLPQPYSRCDKRRMLADDAVYNVQSCITACAAQKVSQQ